MYLAMSRDKYENVLRSKANSSKNVVEFASYELNKKSK